MARTPIIVLMTVGHIEQTAIAKSAAGSDFWKSTRPSGSQASGEIGRSTCMIGSNIRVSVGDTPSRNPDRRGDGDPEQEALRHAHQAVVREQHDALIHLAALGQRLEDVELALFPGAPGEGRSLHPALAAHQTSTARPTPHSGRKK